jgi:hypothetical protein
MAKTTNTAGGLPRGLGTLHFRRSKFWAIFTDENGEKVQVNTQCASRADARLFLGRRVIEVLQAKLGQVQAVLDEEAPDTRARRKRPSAPDARPRANSQKPAQTAGARGAHPGTGSARKGKA